MTNFYNKLSPSTKLLIHGLLAILASAVVTGGEAGYQNFTQSGHLNPSALLVTAWSAFLLYLIPAMYAYVPAHAQQIIKAAYEEKAQLYDALQRAQQIRSAQNVPAVHPPQPVIVQAATPLTPEHVQSIAAQLAVNLINIAANNKAQTPAAQPVAPAQPATPAPDPYVDPLRVSAQLPAYTPPVAIPDQTTQVVPQVPFTV